MTPAGEILRDEITREGPLPFRRFMEVALYHPEHGYYRRPRDPFGRGGDFYTAEQLQPVFGILMASLFREMYAQESDTKGWRVIELGAGRAEMRPYLEEFGYLAVEAGDTLPSDLRGIILANEFFDALAVNVARRNAFGWRSMRVGFAKEHFEWTESDPVTGEELEYLAQYAAEVPEGGTAEIGVGAAEWMRRIAGTLVHGRLLIVDYGYRAVELRRFPQGTLMSYRRHQATPDVLANPGEQDITAHVCFTALADIARDCGLHHLRSETLQRALLRIGERDQFASLLDVADENEHRRRLLQLKALLISFGETFQTALWGVCRRSQQKEKRPRPLTGPP